MLQMLANTCSISTTHSIYFISFTLTDGFNVCPVRSSTSISWLCDITVKEVNHNRVVVQIKN